MDNSNKVTPERLYILQAQPPMIISLDPDRGVAEQVISNLAGIPDGIQVDGPGKIIYWTNMGVRPKIGEDFINRDGSIECCSLDGQKHAVLVSAGTIVTPKQLQLDTTNGLLYWCDREGMAVMRCRVDGSELKLLLRTGNWPEDTHDILRHCVGIALDMQNRHIYWTQKGPPDAGRGRIFRMGIDLPLGATAETRADVELLLDALPEPIDIEIDHDRHQLYWTDRGDLEGGNSLNRANITPEGLMNHQVLATGLLEGIGLALDLERRRVFLSDLSGAIRVLAMDGGNMATIHQSAGATTGLAYCAE
ncbi:3-hydroxyacyl-CoA dehydrogenase [Phyllobacterium sp. TAF24]|uniref:3-hydroxyacyl-CoA dehydrogenase n=1 Tax=Phyllobacterium sp. TAF24 TaxID=3233068 RepID=UPI003F9E97EF